MSEASDRITRAGRLIYDYQKKRLESEYSDFAGMEDVMGLFFGHFYPPPEKRPQFEKLKRAFVKTSKNPLLRIITTKWVRGRLSDIIELDGLTLELNAAMAAEIAEMEPMPESLDDDLYFELSRRATAYDQRERQVECAMSGYELGEGVVIHFPMDLNQIIKYVPRALVWNKDLFDLAVETYKVFENHRNDLAEYRQAARERETARLKKMFGKDEGKG